MPVSLFSSLTHTNREASERGREMIDLFLSPFLSLCHKGIQRRKGSLQEGSSSGKLLRQKGRESSFLFESRHRQSRVGSRRKCSQRIIPLSLSLAYCLAAIARSATEGRSTRKRASESTCSIEGASSGHMRSSDKSSKWQQRCTAHARATERNPRLSLSLSPSLLVTTAVAAQE